MYKIINIDMDGVLANFNGRVKELTSKTFEEFSNSNDAWDSMGEYIHNIYLELEVLNNAELLVEEVIDFADKHGYLVSVLTGLPKRNIIPKAEEHKRLWIKKYFPVLSDRFKIGPHSEDKWKHCYSKHDILIDDYWKNIDQWEKVGGKAIKYDHNKDLNITLAKLYNSI